MKFSGKVRIHDCWKITGRGIIAELEHFEQGLPPGVILRSTNSNDEWSVMSRILEMSAGDKQLKFPSEKESATWSKYKDHETMLAAISNLLDKEAKNIFHYHLQPNGHENKPQAGEELLIVSNI